MDETITEFVCSLVIPKAFYLQDLFTQRYVSDHVSNSNVVDISIVRSVPGSLGCF